MSALLAVRHGWAERDGLSLHLLDFGGEGQVAVCLHGVTGHAWAWHDVARVLRGRERVVALDMRGHGDSGWSGEQEYTTAEHVADLEQVLAGLELGVVDLVGSSWGALVALEFASLHPDRLRRLAIVDVEPSFEQGETEILPRPRSFDGLAEAVAFERKNNPRAPDSMVEVMARMGTRPASSGCLVPKHDPYFFERWPFRSDDHWGELGVIETPTLLVHAGRSFVRAPVMEKMAAAIRRSTIVEIEEASHVVPVDAPEPLGEALGRFLSA